MYRSILVPLDGAPFGEHALPLALSIARRAGASLQLVHVAVPLAVAYAETVPVPDAGLEKQLQAHHQAYLTRIAGQLERVSPVPVTTAVLGGEIAAALRGHAAATGADLVVMTTHGRGPLRRLWLGSVADELVRDLPVPLLLVRPHGAEPDWAHEPVLRHVLLPLDGTALAEGMLEPGVALGTLMGAEYTLLRAVKPALPVGYPLGDAGLGEGTRVLIEQIEALHQKLCREARAYLDGVAQQLRAQGLRVHCRVVVEEQPGAAIVDAGRPPDADLIALATHGRRGLSRLMLGSVADKVIRGAAVPVLVQRPAPGAR
jgi:nucleotide-binding universal stress UspA family protein